MSSVSVPAPPKRRRRVLDPSERSAEVLFGVIMVLTFTGSLSAATSGREEVRTMLIGAVGCNLAWGIVDAIMYLMVSVLTPDELDAIRRRLAALPFPARRPALTREDLRGALGVFLLVFLSTFPIVVPFLVMREARPALRASNAVAIVMLYLAGSSVGRFAGFRPWKTGLGMVLVGLILVAITIALGG
jgi:hypothetical protein